MIFNLSQQNRALGIQTELEESDLFVESIRGKESLGDPFEYVVSTVAGNDNFLFDDLIGTSVTVRMEVRRMGAERTRFFNGIVSKVSHLGYDSQGNSKYDLTLVPWLWFLSQGSDCRIFQQKTIQEILKEVFDLVGVKNYEFRLMESYQPYEYRVQYRESHLNFVHRLMEHEGIYYYWEQQDGSHKMIICDSMVSHKPVPGFEQVKYRTKSNAVYEDSYLSAWRAHQQVTAGSYSNNSFNFKAPLPAANVKLMSRAEKTHAHKQGGYEVYDNPADFGDLKEGERLAEIRREELQCNTKTISSTSNARGLLVGSTFQPLEVPRGDQSGGDFLIVSCSFQARSSSFGSGVKTDEEESYSTSFKAIPVDDCVYRPARAAEIQRMQGPQTAFVTGPSSEEIFVDKFGRVKVQFHWDRNGQYDAGSSIWVRVSQAWAGVGYGGMNIPRIGQEVIVDFIEGDPDHPIITGRVYNANSLPNASNAGRDGKENNKPPNSLVKAAMMTSLKSSSLGGSGGSNEITMNDAAGAEGLFMKAQKDEIHVVGNDRDDTVTTNEKSFVGANRDNTVVKDEKLLVKGARHREVVADELVKVTGDLHETHESNHYQKTVKDVNTQIMGSEIVHITGTSETKVNADVKELYAASQLISVGGNLYEKVDGNAHLEVAGMSSQKAGMILFDADKIVFKVGDNFIEIAAKGITIQGSRVDVNPGGMVPSEKPEDAPELAKSDPTDPTAPTTPEKPIAAG